MQKTETLNMKLGSLNGIQTTVLANADKIGALAGALSSNGINTIISSLQQLSAGIIHPPSINDIQTILGYQEIQTAIMAYVAGIGVEAIAPSGFRKFGGALQKGATAFGLAYFAQKLFYAMTHSEIKGVNIEDTAKSISNTGYSY